MPLVDVLGLAASVISFVLWWPQAACVWAGRKDPAALVGVSIWTQVLLLANTGLWGAYAVATGSFWVGAPGVVNGPLRS